MASNLTKKEADMKGSLRGRINAMVDAALNQKPKATAEEIKAAIMENPEIVWDAADAEIGKRVRARMLARPRNLSHPYQSFFEGYGFRDLSQRITIKTGSGKLETEVRKLTATDLRDWVRSLEISAENTPRLAYARKLLADITPFDRKHRGITFERYCGMLAAGTPVPQLGLTATERSEKIRQQWAALTPAERKAIHEKRLKTRAAKTAKA